MSQNDDKDQNQDQEDQRASTDQYDFAHYIGLQQVFTTHKVTSGKIAGRLALVTASCPKWVWHF